MNDNILSDLNLQKLNIKDLTLLLEILEELNPNKKSEEIEVI